MYFPILHIFNVGTPYTQTPDVFSYSTHFQRRNSLHTDTGRTDGRRLNHFSFRPYLVLFLFEGSDIMQTQFLEHATRARLVFQADLHRPLRTDNICKGDARVYHTIIYLYVLSHMRDGRAANSRGRAPIHLFVLQCTLQTPLTWIGLVHPTWLHIGP
jgi:hypothetical protein